MSSIVKKLQNAEDYCGGQGVSNEQISAAEKKLGVTFSKEYKDYLESIGLCMVNGHELTGISDESRTNVVDVTLYHRNLNKSLPNDLYVIEETNMDGSVILQDKEGSVFCLYNETISQVSNSILEFLSL